MAIVIPAEAAILERVLDAAHSISSNGLSPHAFARFDAAQMKTAWGRRHQRRFAWEMFATAFRTALAEPGSAAADPEYRPPL